MFVNWLQIGNKHTYEARKAVALEQIFDVAGLDWQFDRVDRAQRELMYVN